MSTNVVEGSVRIVGGPSTSNERVPLKISPLQLFVAFSQMALSGFGGVLPFAYRALVERRGWLTPEEFAKLLAISQVMPGPTICNLSVMFGYRAAGVPGSAAALGGMIALPMGIVLGLGVAWHEFGALPPVRRALTAMSAVVAGLILATAMKMSRAVPRHAIPIALSIAAFVCVGLMRLPLLAVIVFVAPVGIFLAWREHW
jgi:chromate transporter